MIKTKFRIVVISVGYRCRGVGEGIIRCKILASSQVGWYVYRCVYFIAVLYNIHIYYIYYFVGIKYYIKIFKAF